MATAQELIADLEKQMKNPIPTPPVGLPVQWYDGDNREDPRAARVTRIEGPGRVAVMVDRPVGTAFPKGNVKHVTDPLVKKDNRHPEVVKCGTWDFVPGMFSRVPPQFFDLHQSHLEKQKKAHEASLVKKPELATV